MSNLLYISRWFRGKAVTVSELMHMDIGFVNTLNRIAYEEAKSEKSRQAKASQDLQDTMHDEM